MRLELKVSAHYFFYLECYMAVFLSTYVNKIDKKGRISVPASFRNVLNEQNPPSSQSLIVFKSLDHPTLEACSHSYMETLSENIDSLDITADERELIETTIFGGSVNLSFDSEGRICIPKDLMEFCEISEQACFVGRAKTFQIWSPERFKTHEEKAREQARLKGIRLSQIPNLNKLMRGSSS